MLPFLVLAQLALPNPLPPVLELAQGFSGQPDAPACEHRGPGHNLGSPLMTFCTWPSAGPGMVGGKLTATIGATGSPTLVEWEVPFASQSRPVELADSLGKYLRNHGFEPKSCEDGTGPAGTIVAVQWRGHGLAVHVSHLVPAPGYQAKLVVMATDTPSIIHPILCK